MPEFFFSSEVFIPLFIRFREEKEKLSDADEGGSEPPALSEEFPSQPSTPMTTVTEEAGRAATPANEEEANRAPWPSVSDLNNRLRRVITLYQRNFKKEELKLAQKAKVTIYFDVYVVL